jgi:hypothetical protein
MPRFILRYSRSPSPKHDKLVKRLVQEFSPGAAGLQPLILEEHVPSAQSRQVRVIWDAWKDIPDDDRGAVIVDAYTQVEGTDAAEDIAVADGVTPQEALALGLLPYKILPVRKAEDKETFERQRAALAAEAKNTLLGARAKELRFARLEDAEASRKRLEAATPGSSWAVVQEQAVES